MANTFQAQSDRALCPLNSNSTAYENSRVASIATGVLFGVSGYNSGTAGFLQLFDATSVPTDGAVPTFIAALPAASNFSVDFGIYGRGFYNGIVAVFSTTGPTKTAGAAVVWFNLVYK